MSETVIQTNDKPEITVEAQGRLFIKGWERNEVRARGEEGSLALTEAGGRLHASSRDTLDLRVPYGAALTITANDEASVKDVTGSIAVRQVDGSLTLRNTGPARIDRVGNDLNVHGITGDLSAGQVGRHFSAREVSGELTAEFVAAHLTSRQTGGGVRAEAGGNANLYLNPQPGQACSITARGSITCRVPPGLNARFTLKSHGAIVVKTGLIQEKSDKGLLELTFGAGLATVELVCNGTITLLEKTDETTAGFDFDFSLDKEFAGIAGELNEQVSEQIAAQLEMIEEQLESQLAGFSELLDTWDLPADQAARIQERTREKIARAHEKIQRAQERAAQKIEQAQRHAAHRAERAAQKAGPARDFRRNWNVELRGKPTPKSDPVSDEERMMILNMLAEKKIGLQEAESLLAALEGKPGK